MAASDRVQRLLSRLTPLDKAPKSTRLLIQAFKKEFPYQTALLTNLKELGVPELADYLVWIPHHRFDDIEEIGKGGSATVYKGTVEAFDEKGFMSLKEDGEELIYDNNFMRTFALKEVDSNYLVSEVRIAFFSFFFTRFASLF